MISKNPIQPAEPVLKTENFPSQVMSPKVLIGRVKKIKGDGKCLFRALVSDSNLVTNEEQLNIQSQHARNLERDLCKFLQQQGHTLTLAGLPLMDIIQTEYGSRFPTIRSYCRSIYKNQIYAGGNELQILSRYLETKWSIKIVKKCTDVAEMPTYVQEIFANKGGDYAIFGVTSVDY